MENADQATHENTGHPSATAMLMRLMWRRKKGLASFLAGEGGHSPSTDAASDAAVRDGYVGNPTARPPRNFPRKSEPAEANVAAPWGDATIVHIANG